MDGERTEPVHTTRPTRFTRVAILAVSQVAFCVPLPLTPAAGQSTSAGGSPVFSTAEQCIVCHSDLRDESGADVSIGHDWRGTMMAHAARDPYWQASVRREVMDNPGLQAEIEDTCATCHMPMARTAARADGRLGQVFAHLAGNDDPTDESAQARDGVSCTVCHQIRPDDFGEHGSFDGGFRISAPDGEEPPAFGPFDDVDDGRRRIMESATGFSPTEGAHVQQSELCATCHTLFTTAHDDAGREVGRLPEQVPYLEWRHSSYRDERSCQDCHMPVAAPAPISSVLGEPREGLSRHFFRGGNAFMLRLLGTYRDELEVTAPAAALEESAARTTSHLQEDTARIDRLDGRFEGGDLVVDVAVRNLAGHKLPTAYPSRRAWLHVQARDEAGALLFESGAMRQDGSIEGNGNDEDPRALEPHYTEITAPDQAQIYESVIVDVEGEVTTALLRGVRYAKDNRLLPSGFDKVSARADVAVRGHAAADPDFTADGDDVRYRIPIQGDVRAATVSVRLLFQTIGYRWAQNLRAYDARETDRFVGYYEAHAADSAVVLATAETHLTRR